ncbi:hypothetical protein [Priestia megaterium]|uniref:hypothetical protein n=1 Tax=Priestia megaterium TaxID=1404 RepID=UPI003EEBD969
MRLEYGEALVTEILLDAFNPRYGIPKLLIQKELQTHLLKDQKSKELLYSLQQGINWVNQIVVKEVSKLNEVEKNFYESQGNLFGKKYVVVEGNTRIAILMDKKMKNSFDITTPIPIKIAVQEENESNEQYKLQLMRLQGIAHILVVKEWGLLAKGKHLYELYIINKQLFPELMLHEIFRKLALDLGMALSDVRNFIHKYIFYNQITDLSDEIEHHDWKFLEVFEQNEDIRRMFGWDKAQERFEWELNIADDKAQIKRELLSMFPKIIDSAKREGLTSKKLRDVFRKIDTTRSIEDIFNEINLIVSEFDDSNSWEKNYGEQKRNQEDEWKSELSKMLDRLMDFPVGREWTSSCIEELENIKRKVDLYLKTLQQNVI